MASDPPADWVEAALNVTGHFEDSADPMGAVSGDFDGMGISLGVLQWNIGSGSLQPMVRRIGRAGVIAVMPHYGVDLWNACNSTIPGGLAIVRGWQSGAASRPAVFAELKAFTHGAAFVAQQVQEAKVKAATAWAAAGVWSASDPGLGPVTKADFCWFFDVFTQNGGLKTLGYPDVSAFIAAHGAGLADDAVCDWLAARPSSQAGYRDSRKNAVLWRNKVAPGRIPLFLLSFLRARKAIPAWQADVLNRKATIATGGGFVHLGQHDLKAILGL